MNQERQLVVIAGPNGAGKSTLVGTPRNARILFKIPMINPDVIAVALDPIRRNEPVVQLAAGRQAIRIRKSYLEQGTSFAFETTLSGNSELEVMRQAQERNYKINLVFVGLNRVNTSAMRVGERVKKGGHSVPPKRLLQRYSRSFRNLPRAIEISDRVFILDNSGRKHRFLLSIKHGRIQHKTQNQPEWLKEIIPEIRKAARMQKTQRKNHLSIPKTRGQRL
jgi:predicted ABC-type ATPase